MAARPIQEVQEEGGAGLGLKVDDNFIKATENSVDYAVVEEVKEVVQFEAMNLVDNLMLVNIPEKLESLDRVK